MKTVQFIKSIISFSVLAGVIYTGALSAVTIDLNSSSGSWTDPTSNGGPVTNISGVGSNQISWGNGVSPSFQKSSYVFVGNTLSNISLDTPFAIGTFTHNNFPITGNNLLTDVNLNTTSTLTIDGDQTILANIFGFIHNETPNNGPGNCCNDIVTFTNNIGSSTSVFIDGVEYVIGLIGFSQNGGVTLTSQFSTIEGQSNVATLYAQISKPEVFVPEPSTYLLMGSMLALGVYVTKRKREKIGIKG